MIAPYVSGFRYVYGPSDKYACKNANPPLPILSVNTADYSNRRVFTRLRLPHRIRAAHLKEKEDHR